jgi:hypothetical protein
VDKGGRFTNILSFQKSDHGCKIRNEGNCEGKNQEGMISE